MGGKPLEKIKKEEEKTPIIPIKNYPEESTILWKEKTGENFEIDHDKVVELTLKNRYSHLKQLESSIQPFLLTLTT
jgi:hypothetical protein